MAIQSYYDPTGAMGGLFAPAFIHGDPVSEAAVAAWNAAHLKTPPKPDVNVAPQKPSEPDAQRNAIVNALLNSTYYPPTPDAGGLGLGAPGGTDTSPGGTGTDGGAGTPGGGTGAPGGGGGTPGGGGYNSDQGPAYGDMTPSTPAIAFTGVDDQGNATGPGQGLNSGSPVASDQPVGLATIGAPVTSNFSGDPISGPVPGVTANGPLGTNVSALGYGFGNANNPDLANAFNAMGPNASAPSPDADPGGEGEGGGGGEGGGTGGSDGMGGTGGSVGGGDFGGGSGNTAGW